MKAGWKGIWRGWGMFDLKNLGEISSRITDGSHFSPTPQLYGYPIANVKDMRDRHIHIDSCTRIKEDDYKALMANGCTIKDGAVLLSKDGTVGKVIVYAQTDEIAALSSICIITPGSRVSPRYLGHVLRSSICTRQYENFMSGSALRRLVLRDIKNVQIPLPENHEQQAIAAILDTLDDAIEKSEALIAKLKQVRAGMLHDLLTCGVDEHGEVRNPATYPHQFKDTPIGLIPKEWRLTNIADIADSTTSGSRGWAAYYSDQGSMFLRIGNLTREHINLRFDDVQYVNPPRGAEGQRTKVEANDLLISITADLGIIGMIPQDFGDAYVNQHIALVRIKPGVKFPRWIGHLLSSQPYQRIFQALNDSGAKAGLNLNAVGALPIVLPSSEAEQETIVKNLDALDEDISKQQNALEKLRKLKTGLSADLLTGQVRIPPNLELP